MSGRSYDRPVPRSHRAYFVLVGLFALWVGAWGFAAPAEVERALPWSVTPLHARFIAAIYLAGLLAMVWSTFAQSIAEVRIPLALASLWTGALLLVSMLHLGEFDFAKPQVAFWMAAYAVFPLWGGWLYFRRGAAAAAPRRSPADPALLLVAALCLVLAAALFLAPGLMVAAWPWKVSPLLARIYAGPFFAYGVCAFMLAREARPEARRIVLASMLAFTLLALLASLLHLRVFRFDGPAAWVWFGGFVLGCGVFAACLLQRPRLAPA
jgi:hypothetical protein